ncbi:acyl-CoA thioesterase [Marmoricola sp. RAF53]|uniref:acyl-CoA thioesterase n=1 Tax=Marmoricola sp. RAF53 TaxID=3233059 RepID=UPI003F99AB03
MRHTTELPMRWADMDLLQHVNNVTYVDYLQEARIDMFAAHPEFRGGEELAEGVVVVRHELEFAAPLKFRKRPILVDSWITEVRASRFTAAYEVYDTVLDENGAEDRVVYLRASTEMAPFVFATELPRRIAPEERAVLERYAEPAERRERLTAAGSSRHVYPLRVRWSDVDAYRHVNNVKYIEYLQEARIAYMMSVHQEGDEFGQFVVARVDVDYRRPIMFRLAPYQVHSWISHVGRTSFVCSHEIRDGDEVLASAQVVAVGFDTTAQRAAPLPPTHLARLTEQLELSGLA